MEVYRVVIYTCLWITQTLMGLPLCHYAQVCTLGRDWAVYIYVSTSQHNNIKAVCVKPCKHVTDVVLHAVVTFAWWFILALAFNRAWTTSWWPAWDAKTSAVNPFWNKKRKKQIHEHLKLIGCSTSEGCIQMCLVHAHYLTRQWWTTYYI